MFGVDIEIDPASRRKMERVLRDFEKTMGQTVEDGINIVAFSSGRRLVNRVHPFGLKKGREQKNNIGRQIDQTFYFVNAGVISGSGMKDAHNNERRYGRVKFRNQRGTDRYQERISTGELESYKKTQQRKAGRVKAAWVSAVESIGGKQKKMGKIPAYIRRHVPSKYGYSNKSGAGMKYVIELVNDTPYLTTRLQNGRDLMDAAADGLKLGFRRIQKMIDKTIEKANREM